MELTTLLILADIAESARGIASVISFVAGMSFLIATPAFIMQRGVVDGKKRRKDRYEEHAKENKVYEKDTVAAIADLAEWEGYKRGSKYTLMVAGPLLVLALIIQTLMPTRKTIYIIAGLKAADGVINSEIGKKTQELLFKKIGSYLDESTEKEKTK